MKIIGKLLSKLIFVFCLILLTAFSVCGQNNNKANENTPNINSNRETGSATSNSNLSGSTNVSNQNGSTNKELENSSTPTTLNQNTATPVANSNTSNANNSVSDSKEPNYVIEWRSFKLAGFPFWFNVVVLLILAGGFVYLTFWHIPDKIKNISGVTIMKISILSLILLILAMAVFFGFYGQSNGQNTTNENTARNTGNTAVTVQTNQNTNSSTNTVANTVIQPNTNSVQTTETNSSTPKPTTDPVVEDIYKLGYENDKDERNKAGIRDIIVVKVENLKKLVNDSLCRDDKGNKKSGCTEQKIALFLDGRKIDAVEPEAIKLDGNDGTIQFHLSRNAGVNDEAWADLLGNPDVGNENFFYRKDTKASVGLANEFATAKEKSFDLIRIREYRFWIFSILYLFLLFLIYRLAVKSDILRDIGEQPDGSRDSRAFGIFRAFEFGKKDEVRKPYSLARFQMAFWFLLVIGSFFYIYLITGALDIITTEILALIGIGSGTALGAAAIDAGKRETVNSDLDTKQAEIKRLEEEIAALDAKINKSSPPDDLDTLESDKKTKAEKLAKLTGETENLGNSLKASSKGFLKDILSDATGVSFHRFQMFVWTLVLGVIFIISVWSRLSMPEFGPTLLALLGISTVTYLGFKIPENKTKG